MRAWEGVAPAAHLVVAQLKVEVLDPAVRCAAPVAAKQCVAPQQVERPCHGRAWCDRPLRCIQGCR